ncbi:MAG: N-methyl-L-tryptophan oxidase, partial [Chloroflexi bacterium]|nr:N-methyl-L-tryptophan oxidase [Chloroflexota bacterium]
MTNYDVAIIGLGAMGSAAAYHLAKRGASVIGLDRFTPPHMMGSSHGDSRIIREAYHESPAYVPIVQRSYELWAELEAEAGETLLRQTGGVMFGPPEGETVAGARRSAELHGLAHEVLDAAEARRRWPQFAPPDEFAAIYEDRSGILFPERCIAAHLDVASRSGAELRYGTQVSGWTADGDGVTLETFAGSVSAGQLLITAGAWLPGLVPELNLPLEIERQVLFWFEPAA